MQCNRVIVMDNKININNSGFLPFQHKMDITFYKRSRQVSRKEETIAERSNQLTHQNKFVDYVGLTLREYFAKTDQALCLKGPSKRVENSSAGKNIVQEGVFTLKLKDQNKRTFRHRTEIEESQEQAPLANAVVFSSKIHKNTQPCSSTRQSPPKIGVIQQSKNVFRDRHLRKSFILPSPYILPAHSLLREELTQHLQKLKDSSNLIDINRIDVGTYVTPFKIRELKPMALQHKKHNKSLSEHSSQVEVRQVMLKKNRAQMMLKMSPKKKQKQLANSGRCLHIIK